MRVLIINDLLIHGGAEMQGLREKKILEEKNNEVFFLTFDNNFPSDSEIYSKKNGFYNIKINNFGLEKIKNKLFFNKDLFRAINKIINDINPEIIHVNNLYLAPITQYKALKKWNTVQTIRDYSAVCPLDTCIKPTGEVCLGKKYNNCYFNCGRNNKNIFKIWRANKYNKIRMRNIIRYICPSEKLTVYCKEHGYNIKCINNPFDFDKFKKFPKNTDFKCKRYIYYGNINREKGVVELIKAFNVFSQDKNDVKLLIAGKVDKQISSEFKELCKNDKVSYLGYLNYNDMLKTLEKVYAIVVPSLWMENYPNTVLEGLSTKTLVLGSNRGGIPAMLDNNRGIIFDILDQSDIIDKLQKSYEISVEKYKTIVDNAYDYTYDNNNIKKYYERLLEVFNY